MAKYLSYRLVLAGLLCLLIILPWWLQANTTRLGLLASIVGGAAGPAVLLFIAINRTRNWAGITALCMIPFATIGVMDLVANIAAPFGGLLLATLSIATFFAALDAGRRLSSH